jgi:hypothetical protein
LPLRAFRQDIGLLPFETQLDVVEDGDSPGLPQREAAIGVEFGVPMSAGSAEADLSEKVLKRFLRTR